MKRTALLLLAVSLVDMAFATDEILVVRGNPNVYTFKPEPSDGTGHSDGIASLDLRGIVVEEPNGNEAPIAGVKFRVEPNRSFSQWNNRRIIFLSNTNGQFLARLYVGAAMTNGGKTPGRVYQTRRSKLRIEKEGYKTTFLWFDFKMPEVKIIMRKEDTQQVKSKEQQIRDLIDQLASRNSPPTGRGWPGLDYPDDWNEKQQEVVCDAERQLRGFGKFAFPILLDNLDDHRYSCTASYLGSATLTPPVIVSRERQRIYVVVSVLR